VVFIGLPGASSQPIRLDPAPEAVVQPPEELSKLYNEMLRGESEAVKKMASEEVGTGGYETTTSHQRIRFRAYCGNANLRWNNSDMTA
jgi:hypothetical protein